MFFIWMCSQSILILEPTLPKRSSDSGHASNDGGVNKERLD